MGTASATVAPSEAGNPATVSRPALVSGTRSASARLGSPDASGIGTLRLTRGDPYDDPPKLLREFVNPIDARSGESTLGAHILGNQRFDSPRRSYPATLVPGAARPNVRVPAFRAPYSASDPVAACPCRGRARNPLAVAAQAGHPVVEAIG